MPGKFRGGKNGHNSILHTLLQPLLRFLAGMRASANPIPKQAQLTILSLLCLCLLGSCNLAKPQTTLAPTATAAIPQARILYPPHNQRVIEGVIFDIDILASDHTLGIERVEFYVDEVRLQTSISEGGPTGDFRVTMNWFAKGIGWHKFSVIAYRQDGAASHPHSIALEVIPPG